MQNPLSTFKNPDQSWGSFFLEFGILIAVVLFVRFYVFQFFQVSGPSMCNTLNQIDGECQHSPCRTFPQKLTGRNPNGSELCEFIFVNEFRYSFLKAPARGEIVVFTSPAEGINLIKRVIGTPGDRVKIENGKVFWADESSEFVELPELYLSEKNKNRTILPHSKTKTFEVPEGKYFLMGDNRTESMDSRHCFEPHGCDDFNTSFVEKKQIKGRSEFVIWPVSNVRWLDHLFLEEKSVDSATGEK
ncbi:signal peptidase I [bacterium]|jgi:signal peptidase I|nr:signal peptidase I [bacterium]MBT7772481.1 signal peptidase I [bacterium]